MEMLTEIPKLAKLPSTTNFARQTNVKVICVDSPPTLFCKLEG